jgi:acyl-CoA thioester hydrolase
MFQTKIKLRIRYAETDRMGYVYYGNYAVFFEVARVEALRELGFSYRNLEDGGILLPVTEYNIRFLKPAFYDEEVEIVTSIPSIPGARIRFEYETRRGSELLNKASTELVFINKESGRPMKCPAEITEAISKRHL